MAQHCGLDELKSPVTEGGSSERLCREENSCLLCVAPRSVFEQTMHASGQLSELCYSSALFA